MHADGQGHGPAGRGIGFLLLRVDQGDVAVAFPFHLEGGRPGGELILANFVTDDFQFTKAFPIDPCDAANHIVIVTVQGEIVLSSLAYRVRVLHAVQTGSEGACDEGGTRQAQTLDLIARGPFEADHDPTRRTGHMEGRSGRVALDRCVVYVAAEHQADFHLFCGVLGAGPLLVVLGRCRRGHRSSRGSLGSIGGGAGTGGSRSGGQETVVASLGVVGGRLFDHHTAPGFVWGGSLHLVQGPTGQE